MKQIIFGLMMATFAMHSAAMNHHEHQKHSHQPSHFETITVDGITLTNFRARASIGQMKNSGAYGDIRSVDDDYLIEVSSQAARIIELHEHIHDNGVMRMREVEGGFALAADETMVMKPGGYHIMLIGLVEPLKDGTSIDLKLKFKSGKTIDASVPVVSVKKMHD